jgi:hypothetical protein
LRAYPANSDIAYPELFEVAQNCELLRAHGRTRIRRMFAFSWLFTAGRKGTQIFHIKSQPNNLTSCEILFFAAIGHPD